VRDDALEHGARVLAGLGRGGHRVVAGDADDLLELLDRAGDVGGRQVDLVDDRQHLQAVVDGEVGVLDRLRLDALGGVDHQQHALAGAQRARDLVVEVDVTRGVDEVEEVRLAVVGLVVQAHGRGLDRDAALALELQRVEHLVPLLAFRHALGELQDAVGEGRLAVVDVGDDREVADLHRAHRTRRSRDLRSVSDARRAA
jgi:hypothetical protein